MTDLTEKAQQNQGPEIVTTGDLGERPPGRIDSAELVAADDLTAEGQFPEFGEFLVVEAEGEEEYWECNSELAALIVNAVEESEKAITDHVVSIMSTGKNPAGEWQFMMDVTVTDDS